MAHIDIVNEVPLTLVEVKEKLQELKGKEKELPLRLNKTMEYLKTFSSRKESKHVTEFQQKLQGLDISRLRDRHIVKILDIMPKDLDSLRAIFSSENVTLKQDDLKKILDILHGN